MPKIHTSILIFFLTLSLCVGSFSTVLAQETLYGTEKEKSAELPFIDAENAEIRAFAEIYDQMVEIEGQYNLKIIDIVQNHGMEMARYETLNAAERMNLEVDVQAGEMANYRKIRKEIMQLKQETLDSMRSLFIQHQFDHQKYRNFLMKARKDSLFQHKVDSFRKMER